MLRIHFKYTRGNWGKKTMNWSQLELHGSVLAHRERKKRRGEHHRNEALPLRGCLEHPLLTMLSLWKTEKTLGSGIPVRAAISWLYNKAPWGSQNRYYQPEKRAGRRYPQLGLSTWLYTMGIVLVYNPSFPHPRAHIQRQTEKWGNQYRGENLEYAPTDIP